jgi:predicted alpha/beta hydrolase
MNLQNVKQKTIKCSDSVELVATIYEPTITVKGAVMMAPATGIKRQFYANFANYLANNGYGVITFDNRGIGGSSTGPVTQNAASLQCWGEKDMPAVLECL